jgi:hypothetical protein
MNYNHSYLIAKNFIKKENKNVKKINMNAN